MAQGFQAILPQRLFDTNGQPADLWEVSTWVADGTFTTPLTTYSNATLTSANTNPIITADGYFRCFVAQDVQLDISVTDENGVPQSPPQIISLEPMSSGFDPATSYNRTGATDTSGTYLGATITTSTLTQGNIFSDTKQLAADATASSASTGATLTSLTGFSWTLVTGGTYAFRVRGKVGFTTNGGLSMAFKYTTATLASILVTAVQRTASVFALASSTTVTDQTKFIDQKAVLYVDVELEGSLVVTTGGTVAVQFAQNTSHSDVTTVFKGMVAEFVRTA